MDTALPKSSIPFVRFPAIAGRQGSTLLTLLYQLDRSQWWTPEQLLAQQGEQLAQLLAHAWRTTPFYRERLHAVGYSVETDDPIAIVDTLPILTRTTLQQDMDRIRSTQIPESHGRNFPISTSGTTGRAVKLTGTAVTQIFWHAFNLRDHFWHRRDFSAKLAAIRWASKDVGMPPHGEIGPNWGLTGRCAVQHRSGRVFERSRGYRGATRVVATHRSRLPYLLSFASRRAS